MRQVKPIPGRAIAPERAEARDADRAIRGELEHNMATLRSR